MENSIRIGRLNLAAKSSRIDTEFADRAVNWFEQSTTTVNDNS